jgi:hypothetical protein
MKKTLLDKASGLQFEWDDEVWQFFESYDAHTDVRGAAAKGLSCIDIIGIHQERRIFLIEAKNFKNRLPEEVVQIEQRLLKDDREVIPIAEEFLQNVKDSLLFLHFYSARLQQDSWGQCKSFLTNSDKEIFVVLWLELDIAYPNIPKGRISLVKEIIRSTIVKKLRWLTSESKVLVAGFSETLPDVEVKIVQY